MGDWTLVHTQGQCVGMLALLVLAVLQALWPTHGQPSLLQDAMCVSVTADGAGMWMGPCPFCFQCSSY